MDKIRVLKYKGSFWVIRFDPNKWREYKQWMVGVDGVVKNKYTGKIIGQEYNTKGYLRISIDKRWLVHRLVMWVWKGHSDLQVDHLNGKRDDNRLSNLEYVTAGENQRRKRKGIKKYEELVDGCPF